MHSNEMKGFKQVENICCPSDENTVDKEVGNGGFLSIIYSMIISDF